MTVMRQFCTQPHHRRPGESQDPLPRSALSNMRCGQSVRNNSLPWLWVLAFARTTQSIWRRHSNSPLQPTAAWNRSPRPHSPLTNSFIII